MVALEVWCEDDVEKMDVRKGCREVWNVGWREVQGVG